jgi:hypothetical protein
MGFGKIYETTWWGFSSSTGFGNIYDQYNNADKLANFFEIRVEADGGTVESKGCLSALGLIQYKWEYNNRVEADGGTIESLECVTF